MKAASAAMIALLNAQQFLMADLYTFTLANTAVLRYTDADGDLTAGGNVFSSVGPLLARGQTRCIIGVEVDTLDVEFLYNPSVTINGLPVAQFAANGGFDGARLLLERVFMPVGSWGDTSAGALIQFVGRVAELDATRSGLHMLVNSDLELLSIMLPRNIYQAGCIHSLYDAGCALVKASFAVASAVQAGSTTMLLNCALAQAAGYFDLGTVTFASGANSGLSRTVKSYAPGVLALAAPLPNTPAVSDTFNAFPGCDKLQSTCSGKFNNLANFRGFPYIPVAETSY